ncbi:S-layer homology domain-containing protein [Paenibacillus sp. GCM10027626]|uniref:S-layer homology domain-containing protein n=1 Tax=Paenibacillus sp. GCM10027626 TaxID=3273411 RepID=UPI00364498B8
MPIQNKWNRTLSSVTIAAVLLSGTAVWGQHAAGAETTVSATSFSDVSAEHWAAKHIAKLSAQKIVLGNNGQFKPNDNISQQEAVIMALRFIGKDKLGESNQEYVFPESFKVSNYAKPYVGEAIKLKLIDSDVEFKSAEAAGDAEWGSRKASREWVTKLIVRAIGQQQKAEEMAKSVTNFGDAQAIGDAYRGYINAAVSLDLIKGVTPTKFDPKGLITRASIATIFSRAESIYPVAYAGQSTGIITAIKDSSISVYQDKEVREYSINPDTFIYKINAEKQVSLSQLDAHTDIMLISDSEGKVLYVEQLGDQPKVEKMNGTIARVIADSNVIWIAKDNDPNPITLNYGGSLVIKDSAGAAVPISSLEVNSKVEIVRDTYRDKPEIVSINVQSAPVNKSAKGTIKSISASELKVTNEAGAEETYKMSNAVDIIWQGRVLTNWEQLVVGDTISFEVKESIVTKITKLTTGTSTTVRGQFESAVVGKSIQFKLNGDLIAKYVADQVNVQIEGMSNATLTDLVPGDEIEVTLNEKEQVVAVKATNRKIKVVNGAVILNYDEKLKVLSIYDEATNAPLSVQLSDNTRISNSGSTIALNGAAPLLIKNRRVSVGYTDNKAVFLELVYKYTGQVTAITGGTSGQMTLALTNGSKFTIGLQYPGVEIQGKTNATLSDVKIGDTISALLNGEQDKVVMLQVHSSKQYEIASVDTAARKLRVKGANSVISELPVAAFEIYNEKEEKIDLSNLTAGQVISVIYAGNSPFAIKKVIVKPGQVTAVTADKLNVTTYSGEAVEIPLNQLNTVVKIGDSTVAASTLKVGDRVEVRTGSNQTQINVSYGESRKFWKYDAAAGELSFKRSNLNDENYKFRVAPNVKVTTADGASISISQLKDNDALQVYMYQGVIYEIVKTA